MSPELDNPPALAPMVGKAARTRSGKRFGFSRLQIAAWVLLVTMAAIQMWEVRHLIYSDGVTYLDIAGHYMLGDWRHALSDYWSPLFPWILAGVFRVFRTPAYWETATLHAVNFGFFVLSLAALELFVKELLRKQERTPARGRHLSPAAIRVGAYCALMWAGLHLIGIGSVTPDMIAMALTFLTCYLLLRIDAGTAHTGAYVALGATLGLGFLDRAALLPMIPICLAVALILLRRQRMPVWRPLLTTAAASAAVVFPFLLALAAVYGHFTLGTTGKLNYAFEVAGAARHIHWQGEPGDIGVPTHPTKKVLDHPATYTFADDVPGAYPLWYRPSYWYEGVDPHLKLGPQIHIILAHSLFLSYLLLFSPLALPFLALAALAGWQRWVSEGLAPYLFLLVPMLLSIGVYSLVFLERRYIAGHLVVIWLCLLAGVPVMERFRRRADVAVIAFILLFSFVAWVKWMARGTVEVAADAVRMHESEWNIQWMLADRFRHEGVAPGDRIAYIGQSIDSDWVRMTGAKIVAEVPVVWDRYPQMNRAIKADKKEIDAFWRADPRTRASVIQKFREAGASFVVADNAPLWALSEGWTRIFPPGAPHLPDGTTAQSDFAVGTAYLRLK